MSKIKNGGLDQYGGEPKQQFGKAGVEGVMDYCYRKNPLNFGVGLTRKGRLAAILDFCRNIWHMDQMQHGGSTSRLLMKINDGKS